MNRESNSTDTRIPNSDNGIMKPETRNWEPGTRKKVVLVDGNSYLYRAFYATPYLSNSKGVPTNATYAFLSMLKKLLNDEKPDALVVVFDSKVPSFREEISKAYKAQRPPMPGNLSTQIPYVKAIVEAMGLPILEREGFEADDVIATVVEQVKRQDAQVYIVTSDKDMMQLVSPTVFVLDTMKNLVFGEQEVLDKFGIRPALITDYLALAGDTSDNIPGVPGVGEKTARELVASLGGVEDIYSNLEKVNKVSVRTKLIAGKDLAEMSRQLATLRKDVPLDASPESISRKGEDVQALRRIFRELEFTALYGATEAQPESERTVREVALEQINPEKLSVVARFRGKNAFDMQLEGFSAFDGENVSFSEDAVDLNRVLSQVKGLVTHNLKPLLTFARSAEQPMSRPADHPSPHSPIPPFTAFDTMLAAYLINPLRKDYGIEIMAAEFLGAEIAAGSLKDRLNQCAIRLPELKHVLLGSMKEMELEKLFFDTEMPLVEVLADMERRGVRVNRSILMELSREFDKRLTGLMKRIYELAGEPFNINSPQQLSRILFDTLQLPPQKKTKTGYSTDIEVLEVLSSFHDLPKAILEYRTLAKLKSTYIDVLPTLVNPHTGRIHASFNQMVVATGRLSSSDPNLQNIPIRGEEGRKIREAFIPAEGFVLLSSDYSQIELRVLAHLSNDPVLVETFMKDEDIHTRVAGEVFKVGPDEVTHEMRRTAKVINFGIIYGMSAYGLARELDISQKDAQSYINDYFDKHKGVKAYMDRTLGEAREKGYVKTLYGRVRYLPEINNPDQTVRQLGERAAMNTPVQGTAADIIKMAMVSICKRVRSMDLSSHLIMQIHDELVFEVKEEEVEVMEGLVRDEMEHVISLSVPLKVSLGKGKNWASAHD
jgi:DNA polymerase I